MAHGCAYDFETAMHTISELLENARRIDERLKNRDEAPVVVAHQDAVIVDHEARIEALEARIEELMIQKPRRGRPRKTSG